MCRHLVLCPACEGSHFVLSPTVPNLLWGIYRGLQQQDTPGCAFGKKVPGRSLRGL